MDTEDAARIVVGQAIHIHKGLGPGLFESTYAVILERKLVKCGLKVDREKKIDICFEDVYVPRAFCVDMIVNDDILIELKSVENIAPIHAKQLLTYLRLTGIRVGLLINFGQTTLAAGLHRVINGYPRA